MANSATNPDRPDLQPFESAFPWPLAAVAVLVMAAIAGYAWYLHETAIGPAVPQPAASIGAAVAPPPATLGPQHPVEQKAQSAPPLPALDQSDTLMRQTLSALIGRKAFAEFVIPKELVRRIVASVDNLPRPSAPRRMIPLNSVPGKFIARAQSPASAEALIDPTNSARYTPYVRVLEAIDERALVRDYVRAYPLFQRAYEELGYPGRYFNDRLMQAIDDMLGAPEVTAPIPVMRPRVLYEFADPDLETRSAGQKILLRMGAENAARVKAKLRAIRAELVAAARRS